MKPKSKRRVYFDRTSIPVLIIAILFTALLLSQVYITDYIEKKADSIFLKSRHERIISILDITYNAISPLFAGSSSEIESNRRKLIAATSAVRTMSRTLKENNISLLMISLDGTLLADSETELVNSENILENRDNAGKYIVRELISSSLSLEPAFVKCDGKISKNDIGGIKSCSARTIPGLNAVLIAGLDLSLGYGDLSKAHIYFSRWSAFISFLLSVTGLAAIYILRSTNRRLRFNKTRFESVFNGIDHFITLLDKNFRIIAANRSFRSLFGTETSSFIGKHLKDMPFYKKDITSAELIDAAVSDAKTGIQNRYEIPCTDLEGNKKIMDFSVYPMTTGGRGGSYFIAEGRDITQLKEKENEIYRLAYYDTVTSLPNERLFSRLVKDLIESGNQMGAMLAVIKITSLSFVSTTLGFDMGDKMLRSFAERMSVFDRLGCPVGKLTSGNFCLFIPHFETSQEIVAVNEALSSIYGDNSLPLSFGGHEMHISITVGAAMYPNHGTTYDELLINAMTAREESKHSMTKSFELFDSQISKRLSRKGDIERELRSPGLEKHLSVDFQPQVQLSNNRIVGFEALARWNHPTLGSIPPSEFIPIAEASGFVERVFAHVLHSIGVISSSCDTSGAHISVNVSAAQLIDEKFPQKLTNLLNRNNLESTSIPIEITESLLIESFDAAMPMLRRLKALGHQIHLDDFGTGFSSLSYLRSLPIDILKLDKIFVHDVDINERSRSITSSIINISHDLGIKVVAEGVETEKQAEILRHLGCDYFQGWLTGKPISEECIIRAIESIM